MPWRELICSVSRCRTTTSSPTCRPPCSGADPSSGALRGDLTQPPGLEVLERLQHLGFGVHDERPTPGDWFADRPATQEQQLEVGMPALLLVCRSDGQGVPTAEDDQLSGVDGPAFSAGVAVACEDVCEGVEVLAPR